MIYKIFQFRFVLSICYRIFKPEYLHKRNACFSRQRTPLHCFSPCRNIDIYLRTKRRCRAFLGHLQDFLFLENRAGAWEKIQAWNYWYYLNNKKAQKEFTIFFHAEKYLNNLKRIFKHKKKETLFSVSFFCFGVSAFPFCTLRKAKPNKPKRIQIMSHRKRAYGLRCKTSRVGKTWLLHLLYRNNHIVSYVRRAVRVERHGIAFRGIQFVTDFPDVTIWGFDYRNNVVIGFVSGNHMCGIRSKHGQDNRYADFY